MNILFSVVLATRDRPALFQEALESVLTQSCQDFEVIVVNDGSRPDCLQAYQAIWDDARQRIEDSDRRERHGEQRRCGGGRDGPAPARHRSISRRLSHARWRSIV